MTTLRIRRIWRPITIRGVTYPSHTHAAKAVGVVPSTITLAKATGTLETVGLGRKVPLTVRGTYYDSVREAARAIGVSEGTVSRALNNGKLDLVGLTKATRS